MSLPVTVRIPAADYNYLGNCPGPIKSILYNGIQDLHRTSEPVASLRERVIKKPLHETKVRLSAEQFYAVRSWGITPGSIVSWMIERHKKHLEQLHAARSVKEVLN